MILLGSLANGLAIIGGSLLGAFLRNISEQTKDTVTKGIGIGVIALGLQMAIKTDSFTLVIISLCVGALIGEGLKIEDGMNRLGLFLQKHFAKSNGNFAEGFVTSSLIFVVGSMGIIGAIQSGVSGDNQTLYTKAVMDGFLAIMLTASLGIGVLFSSLPVFIYQGIITLFASVVVRYVPQELLTILVAGISQIGGLLIIAIGLNLIKLTNIRVSNFLPSLIILVFFLMLRYYSF
ncbi:DUF554 domain-containing protein [Enterococcus sp. JM9B]|uniref:DUF554 domain-containing protein n=1 Tax=Enterococcus sp. JM9B TaxID=1857216 RepID=UPI001374CE54|nr:DUF554 domain-containing protein [Enterococcus sp. JM9B]KAF1301612.1 hypothetical protein BAU16_08790 [Enterococcus sp. JM9B]